METEYWICKTCEYGISGPKYSAFMTSKINTHENTTGHVMEELTDDVSY